METTVSLLSTYSGRDRIIRTVSYAAMLLSGTMEGRAGRNWGVIARQLSAARTVLRLFDDLPTLTRNCAYGLGSKEKDPVLRIFTLLNNLANQLYFPIEHIAWLADQEILPIKSSPWWTLGISTWACSLVTGILRSLRTVGRLRSRRAKLISQHKLESPEKSGQAEKEFKDSLALLHKQELLEYINLIKNMADFLNAINWLPKGVLWSGKLSTAQSGLCGTISSLAGLGSALMTR